MKDPIWLQGGALGIVGFTVVTLVTYVTRSLNGRLGRLADAIDRNTVAVERLQERIGS